MKSNNRLLQVLAPFGQWPHVKGNQIVDSDAAYKIKRNAEKLFAAEIPVYFGHPDETKKDCSKMRVGRIEKIFPTENGIIVSAVYNDRAFEKIKSGKVKSLSPRWEMEHLGGNDYRPVRLVSVGLTNNPNIDGSGTIIDVGDWRREGSSDAEFDKAEEECKSANAELSRRQEAILQKTRGLEARVGKAAESVKNAAVELRLGEMSAACAPHEVGGKSLKDFSELARNISLRTGEPYTKAFARLRKTVKTNK